MEDNRTANRDYLLPSPQNKMRSEDVPRLIAALAAIDADVAALIAAVLGKAAAVHTHEMSEILGLISALAGKAPLIHSHNIGSLGGTNLADAAANQFMGFNGSLWIPTSIATIHLANKIITNAKLRDSDPFTVIGRASASLGPPADISATVNDRLLARVGDVLAFTQLTLGMFSEALRPELADAIGAVKLTAEGQLISGGSGVTPKLIGNLSGQAYTLSPASRPTQIIINNGSGQILPGAVNGSFLLWVVNAAGAGSPITTGWTIPNGSASFDLTATSKFLCSCHIDGTYGKVMHILKVAS